MYCKVCTPMIYSYLWNHFVTNFFIFSWDTLSSVVYYCIILNYLGTWEKSDTSLWMSPPRRDKEQVTIKISCFTFEYKIYIYIYIYILWDWSYYFDCHVDGWKGRKTEDYFTKKVKRPNFKTWNC